RGSALAGNRDFRRQLAEKLRLLGVLAPLAVHDVLELGMAGHCWVSRFVGNEGGKARPYRPLIGQNQRILRRFGTLVVGLPIGEAMLTMTSCPDERMPP